METLSYGTHYLIDAHKADPEALQSERVVTDLLLALANLIEPEHNASVIVSNIQDAPTGLTAGIYLNEAFVSLHTFPDIQAVATRVFSRHTIQVSPVTALLREYLKYGRFESQVSNHSKTLVSDPERMNRVLLGERNYTALRLSKSNIF